jgi:hypothetical protein
MQLQQQNGVRQHPRYKVTLPVELRSPSDQAPLRAQVADICLGGCYVEMTMTKSVSSEVNLTLWVGDHKISATGVVVSNHPSFGNGIKFTHVSQDSKEKLQNFVETLKPKAFGKRL